MQIKTKETVQKTLEKYRWDDLENLVKAGKLSDCAFRRQVYQKGDLTIFQRKWKDGYGIVIETPQCTMYASTGTHLNIFDGKSQVRYCSLSVEKTMSEKSIYQSIEDDAGFINIQGNRDYVFHFMENLPDRYFTLEVDEKAKHISTYWMNTRNLCPIMHRIKKKGKNYETL